MWAHFMTAPSQMQVKYDLKLPVYPGTSQCVKISRAAVDPSQVQSTR